MKKPEIRQKKTNQILIVEGYFDVASLVDAEILNVIATFGSHLDEEQLKRIQFIQDELNIKNLEYQVWYDRDKNQAEQKAQEKAVMLLNENGFAGKNFNWNIKFNSDVRGLAQLPSSLSDPGNFSSHQLKFLRKQKFI